MGLSEAEVVGLVRAIAQDPSPENWWFEDLVREFDRAVRGMVRMHARDDHADIEDIQQEVWLRVWRALPRYRTAAGSFLGLIRLKARQATTDFYRVGLGKRNNTLRIGDLAAQVGERGGSVGNAVDAIVGPNADPPAPEALLDWEFQECLLRCVFESDANAPHEQIAYGFHRYLEYPCVELVEEEFLERTLHELTEQFVTDFVRLSRIPAERIEPFFDRLRERVEPTGVGGKRFAECFQGKPTDNKVERWVRNVADRIVPEAAEKLRGKRH